MKLAAATVLCALAAASPALAAEKNAASTGLRRLGGSDVCSFLDFEGLWEGVDPSTGAIHNTEMDCTNDSGFMGRKCDVTIVISYHAVCEGKTIFQGAKIVVSSGSPYFFPKTLTFMSRRLVDLNPVITHQYPLSDLMEAFELGKKATDSAKILLIP